MVYKCAIRLNFPTIYSTENHFFREGFGRSSLLWSSSRLLGQNLWASTPELEVQSAFMSRSLNRYSSISSSQLFSPSTLPEWNPCPTAELKWSKLGPPYLACDTWNLLRWECVEEAPSPHPLSLTHLEYSLCSTKLMGRRNAMVLPRLEKPTPSLETWGVRREEGWNVCSWLRWPTLKLLSHWAVAEEGRSKSCSSPTDSYCITEI